MISAWNDRELLIRTMTRELQSLEIPDPSSYQAGLTAELARAGGPREFRPDRVELTTRPIRVPTAGVASQPDQRQPVSRLQIDGDSVLLNGNSVSFDLTPEAREKALVFLRHLIGANGNWVSGGDIDRAEQAKPRGLPGTRWDRVRCTLPETLQTIIESNRRKGYRIRPGINSP
jgi:hypothetical protein